MVVEILSPADEFRRLAVQYCEVAPAGNRHAIVDAMARALAETLDLETLTALVQDLEQDLETLEVEAS